MLVGKLLEIAGHTVIEASDGLSGVKQAQEQRPDLVLMDINIPGMDGYETTTRIKSLPQLSNVPVIALTAKAMTGDRERALAAGCDGFIAKPFDVDAFPHQITEFLQGRRETVAAEEENLYLREHNARLVNHLEEKLRELERTDAMKSRFIDLAAHELRTPLAAVQGYLSILTTPSSEFMQTAAPQTKELLDGVVTGFDRLQGIVQDMLDVTRIEAGTLQLRHSPVSLWLVYKKIKHDYTDVVATRRQTLTIDDASHVPTLWVDGERVIQILRNLVSNAVKYTPDGGHIQISTALLGNEPQQFVKITVQDNGVGIPSEQQDKIFETFHEVRAIKHHSTSKTQFMGGGVGLGLPIARGVAEAHGGSLQVESAGYDPTTYPGSKFHLILPVGNAPK
jgi:signal transduction histidine kinase